MGAEWVRALFRRQGFAVFRKLLKEFSTFWHWQGQLYSNKGIVPPLSETCFNNQVYFKEPV